MSIQHSSTNVDQSSTVLDLHDYALAFHSVGFNVIPVQTQSKAAAIEWKKYQQRSLNREEVSGFDWSNKNIAAISGPNGLRNIDLDGVTKSDIIFTVLTLLGLDDSYPWVMCTPGKGYGLHVWVRCLEELSFEKGVTTQYPILPDTFDHAELRASGCYTLLPPSIHPDTLTPYGWAFNNPFNLDEMPPIAVVPARLLEAAFRAIAPLKAKETLYDVPTVEIATTNTTVKEQPIAQEKEPSKNKELRYDAWAQKALNQELEILQNTSHERNNQLNRSAYSLGQIIGAHLLDRQEIETLLTRAAGIIGLEEGEIQSTIQSGIESGLKKPRMPKQIFQANEPPLQLPKIQNINDEKLASFSLDDQGNAEAVFSLYGKYIAYNEAYGWLVWNGTNFVPSIQRINTIIVETLRHRMQAARHLENTELAKVSKAMAGRVAACRSMLENIAFVEAEKFDDDPDLFNAKNGIIDLRTKKLIPHDPEYRFTWCSPFRYNPQADDTLWMKFLKDTLETDELIEYVRMAIGYCITGHTSEECLFYLWGLSRAGKGTFTEAILNTIPRPIAIEVDFNTFTAKREGDAQNFDLAPLKAARIVFASESNKYQSLNPAKIKALTGGNLVSCSFKHKDMFTYRPQYGVVLSSNHEVNGDPDDVALWGRLRIIPFLKSYLGNEDKTLKFRLKEPAIAESIIAWYVDGAYLWYQQQGRGLQTPKTVADLTEQQRNAQDSIGLWLDECCELKEGVWTENTKIRISYENWCENNGYEPKKAKGFTQSLTAHGIETSVFKNTYTSSGLRTKLRGVQGLTILN